MDFSSFLAGLQDNTNVFTTADVVFTIVLSFILSLVIARVYQITYKGVSYTQSYVHTLIMMTLVVGIIMLVIGSNIARAFSLVGALSIIRFRNAVKDTRDVGYIFFAMAIGMATGTGFLPVGRYRHNI
jgi:ABC-type polysaccharide transport system permease subunit